MQLSCNKCGYEWEYKGKLMRPTCPSCKSTVSVKKPESAAKVTEPESLIKEATNLLGVAAQRLSILNEMPEQTVPEHIHVRIDELRNDIKKIL